MSTMFSRNVEDLSAASRQGLEKLLGAELQSHQRVYIVVDVPPSGPAEPVRVHAAQRIREILAQVQSTSEAQSVPDAEVDGAIEEAMGHVR